MDDAILVKIKGMLKELGWTDEVINNYCDEYARSEEENVPEE